MAKRKTPQPVGGGWYLLPDGKKIQGRAAAYEAAGLDPESSGNRRSDAAKQRHRQSDIELRRSRVAALHLRRVPYKDIATAVGASIGTVANDVKAAREQWRTERANTVEDLITDQLAALAEDEYQLRLEFEAAADPRIKARIYDRIRTIMEDVRRITGANAPEVTRHVLAPDTGQQFGGEGVLFEAGGTDEEYLEAIQAAQGHGSARRLKAVN